MEQPQYWTWMKRKQIFKSDFQVCRSNSINNETWEERAFAEDASGNVGGCIWPPRSYSCSFCKREFGSAQALGGHMNVHRRDRARLKQFDSNSPNSEVLDHNCDVLYPNSEGSRVSEIKQNSTSKKVLTPEKVLIMKNPREETYDDDHDFVETDLLMGFNSSACKRAKKTTVSGFSLLIKQPCLSDRYICKPAEISTTELRLG